MKGRAPAIVRNFSSQILPWPRWSFSPAANFTQMTCWCDHTRTYVFFLLFDDANSFRRYTYSPAVAMVLCNPPMANQSDLSACRGATLISMNGGRIFATAFRRRNFPLTLGVNRKPVVPCHAFGLDSTRSWDFVQEQCRFSRDRREVAPERLEFSYVRRCFHCAIFSRCLG